MLDRYEPLSNFLHLGSSHRLCSIVVTSDQVIDLRIPYIIKDGSYSFTVFVSNLTYIHNLCKNCLNFIFTCAYTIGVKISLMVLN